MAIIEGFRSTNVFNAFILNSIAVSFTVVAALMIKFRLAVFIDKRGKKSKHIRNWKEDIITFIGTFMASMLAFGVLYFLFGFGGGMLVINS